MAKKEIQEEPVKYENIITKTKEEKYFPFYPIKNSLLDSLEIRKIKIL